MASVLLLNLHSLQDGKKGQIEFNEEVPKRISFKKFKLYIDTLGIFWGKID